MRRFFQSRCGLALAAPAPPVSSDNPRMLFAGERVDDFDTRLRYNGQLPDEYNIYWATQQAESYYLGSGHYMGKSSAQVDFIFTGTRFELYGPISPAYQYDVNITIDGLTSRVKQGVSGNVAPHNEQASLVLWYQSPVLPYGVHTAEMAGGGYGGYNVMDLLKIY